MSREQSLQCVAIVPAAGKGLRMGTATKKQFLALDGAPVLVHTLRILQNCDEIDAIIVVVPKEDRESCEDQITAHQELDKLASIISGGSERQDSVYAGLQAVGSPPDLVVIHDGVRPLLTARMLRETIQLAAQGVSAVVGVPVSDTMKSVDSGQMVAKTLSREEIWSIQTPQAFSYTDLLNAYEEALEQGFYGTDDASLIERKGLPVRVIMGSHENIKITSPLDLVMAEAILKQRGTDENRKRL